MSLLGNFSVGLAKFNGLLLSIQRAPCSQINLSSFSAKQYVFCNCFVLQKSWLIHMSILIRWH